MGYYKWANNQLEQLLAKNPTYKRSVFPGMQLGLANATYNSQMPGTGRFRNNLFSAQGNTIANINSNATDASQALAMGAAAQGQTDQSLADLQLQEADWKKFGLQNLNEAYAANQQEDQTVFGDELRKYQDEAQIRGAQAANKLAKRQALWNTVGGIANLGVSAATGGLFKNLFKGKGGGVSKNPMGGFTVSGSVRN